MKPEKSGSVLTCYLVSI